MSRMHSSLRGSVEILVAMRGIPSWINFLREEDYIKSKEEPLKRRRIPQKNKHQCPWDGDKKQSQARKCVEKMGDGDW